MANKMQRSLLHSNGDIVDCGCVRYLVSETAVRSFTVSVG